MNARFRRIIFSALACVALSAVSYLAHAQTYTESVIHSFSANSSPYAGLVQGKDGNFYGTTIGGSRGPGESGTVFEITSSGAVTTLHNFCSQGGSACTDGENPYASLVLGRDGKFYGTTSSGGAYGGGTIFSITPSGTLTTLYFFCSQGGSSCADGEYPLEQLVEGTDGNFYGTTSYGGLEGYTGYGTVFKVTPAGSLTTLHIFCSQNQGYICSDGASPHAGLILANGNFYGTTSEDGPSGGGEIYKITATGTLTVVYGFCSQSQGTSCSDGGDPEAPLLLGTDGNFYGTTFDGGQYDLGTVFQFTPSGTLNTLDDFCDCVGDGQFPGAALIQGKDGNLYGTTNSGGAGDNASGTAYEISPDGVFNTIYSFCTQDSDCSDGAGLKAPLLQASDGNFYGTTVRGGESDVGTVFKLVPGKTNSSTALTVAPNPVTEGEAATLTAAVSGSSSTPTGSVAFSVGGTAIGSGTLNSSGIAKLSASTNGVLPGIYPVIATYAGNSAYSSSQSSAVDVLLNKAFTATALTASPNPVTPPGSVKLTATVTRTVAPLSRAITGTVTFYSQSLTLGTAPVNASGVATFKASSKGFSAGKYAITATYNGDAYDSSSTSLAVTVTVQ